MFAGGAAQGIIVVIIACNILRFCILGRKTVIRSVLKENGTADDVLRIRVNRKTERIIFYCVKFNLHSLTVFALFIQRGFVGLGYFIINYVGRVGVNSLFRTEKMQLVLLR